MNYKVLIGICLSLVLLTCFGSVFASNTAGSSKAASDTGFSLDTILNQAGAFGDAIKQGQAR